MTLRKPIAFWIVALFAFSVFLSAQPVTAQSGPVIPPGPDEPVIPQIADPEVLGLQPVELRLDDIPSTFRQGLPRQLMAGQTPTHPLQFVIDYVPNGEVNRIGDHCVTFPEQAKPALTYAASIWSQLLNSPSGVPIHIEACWAQLGDRILGHASSSVVRNFGNAPSTGTFYAMALANTLSGYDWNGTSAEMSIAYNSDYLNEFYYGNGYAPGDKLNFTSIVLHEIGHGLNFSGSMRVADDGYGAQIGKWGYNTNYPNIYDRFTVSSAGYAMLNTGIYPNPSVSLKTALTTPSITFTGNNARAANGGANVPLYTPEVWNPGSSYSHLAESYNGTANALMTYSVGRGETNYDPGPVALGILTDVGWPFPPTNISISSATLPENAPIGQVVGTLTSTDPNGFENFTYSFASGGADNAMYSLAGNELRTSAAFDYEQDSSHSIRIRSTDRNGLFIEKGLTITVTDENEAPIDITLSASTVAENQFNNTVVGTLSAVDAEGGPFTYALACSGADDALFNIADSQLRANAAFDFETKSTYAICIRATDAGGQFYNKPFTIAVTNVNEAPTAISLSPAVVVETQAVNTVIGRLSAVDPDAGETFSFSFVPGGADNAQFEIAGSVLKLKTPVTRVDGDTYTITVLVSDRGGLTTTGDLTIMVKDTFSTYLPLAVK